MQHHFNISMHLSSHIFEQHVNEKSNADHHPAWVKISLGDIANTYHFLCLNLNST